MEALQQVSFCKMGSAAGEALVTDGLRGGAKAGGGAGAASG